MHEEWSVNGLTGESGTKHSRWAVHGDDSVTVESWYMLQITNIRCIHPATYLSRNLVMNDRNCLYWFKSFLRVKS